MKLTSFARKTSQAGYSLMMTLILVTVSVTLLAATLGRTLSVSKLNDRNNAYVSSGAAAEAAVEKVLSRMMVDFANGGEQALSNNMTYYRNSMLPSTNENTIWGNYQFTDAQGNSDRVYVQRTTTNPNPPYVQLLTQYPGLNAFAATYRVLSNAKNTSGTYNNLIGAVQEDVQMAEIPIFQFAIFYNSLLEFSDCATMSVNGRVHCNTNIYVGTVSGSSLTFNYFVTASGIITNPAWFGFAQSSWKGGLTYSGTPSPGWGTGEPVLTLPIGTNNTPAAVREILNPPAAGETATNAISPQRYYNKADMIITVSDTNIIVAVKASMYDTPLCYTNGPVGSLSATNWTNANFASWLTTNNTSLYDQREGRTNHLTQIDVGKLGTWIGTSSAPTNTNVTAKWSTSNPFNGIIYVQDIRTTNANWMDAVRLTNGVAITNGLYSSGLTLATPNPLYIIGMYNCPKTSYQGTTNTTLSRPCSVACDAITILSGSWSDGSSTGSYSSRNASDTTVNTAMIAGNVLSTGSSDTQFSGGVHNLTRLLEDWSSDTLTLNTSMINLYNSVQASQQFQKPGIYYKPPTRFFMFDLNFTSSSGLPPGTPAVNRMIRATWSTPPPNTVSYVPSPTLDFVPR